jgi:hypothetical protein
VHCVGTNALLSACHVVLLQSPVLLSSCCSVVPLNLVARNRAKDSQWYSSMTPLPAPPSAVPFPSQSRQVCLSLTPTNTLTCPLTPQHIHRSQVAPQTTPRYVQRWVRAFLSRKFIRSWHNSLMNDQLGKYVRFRVLKAVCNSHHAIPRCWPSRFMYRLGNSPGGDSPYNHFLALNTCSSSVVSPVFCQNGSTGFH